MNDSCLDLRVKGLYIESHIERSSVESTKFEHDRGVESRPKTGRDFDPPPSVLDLNNWRLAEKQSKFYDRGVEQLEARRAHNPKVAGSSPAPATG